MPLQLAQASLLPPGIGPPPEVITPNFSFNPFTDGGLSMNFNSPVKNAALAPVQVHGSVALHMLNPYVSYDINITTRGIETAKFEVHNTAGLTLNFEASSNADFAPKDNLKKLVFLPIDLSVPLGGPVPLAFTLHETFMLETPLPQEIRSLRPSVITRSRVRSRWNATTARAVPADLGVSSCVKV